MKYTFDEKSLIRDGKRWFAVMGEIHFSRVPRAEWKERLCKMKAGGVDVASAYVIWIYHEEIEGEYDWSGDRNLRGFLEAAKDCGIKVLLRIGPWCHGEARNGGFPDWLLHKDFQPRTNDERYFAVVENWYKAIYEQVREFVGSTIIGVQIENEFGHCGGLYDESGEEHMKRLTAIAKSVGFMVDLYTATGWGGARTGGLLPVMGGYCDAPWDQRTTEIEPSGNYVFTHERNDHNIGSDHGLGYGITFDASRFPYLTAELGGGLQVTAHRRTIAQAKDIAAVAMVKMGSGCNLLGYYMYTGGTNPDGKLTTLQESRDTGYPNDLPIKSYDFRAPIREFGEVNDTYRELKLLSYFVHDFGEELCAFPAVIPEENPLAPADTEHLRYSFRSDGKRGYVFVNNYVRHLKMAEHSDVRLSSPDGETRLASLTVKNGDFFFLPFNMAFGSARVQFAEATPLCNLGKKTVFYARDGVDEPRDFFLYCDEQSKTAGAEDFIVLSRKDALNAWRVSGADGERLIITGDAASVYTDESGAAILSGRGSREFYAFPAFSSAPAGFREDGTTNKNLNVNGAPALFAHYVCDDAPSALPAVSAREAGAGTYALNVVPLLQAVREGKAADIFVRFSYTGDRAELYAPRSGGKKLLLDHFYLGEDYPWEIGLKRFLSADFADVDFSALELLITPLKRDVPMYLEERPEFATDEIAELKGVSAESEWRYEL